MPVWHPSLAGVSSAHAAHYPLCHAQQYSDYSAQMKRGSHESKLIHLMMSNATEVEVAQATVRWFRFLGEVASLVSAEIAERRDSHDTGDVR